MTLYRLLEIGSCVMIVVLFVGCIWGVSLRWLKKMPATTSPSGDPYRTSAQVEDPPTTKIKPKREFKMPEIKMNKFLRCCFPFLSGTLCIAFIGIVADSKFIGEATKVSVGIALAAMAIFLGITTVVVAEKD